MAEYRDQYPAIRQAGAGLAAVSVDQAERSEQIRRELKLPFPILCDTERRIITGWRILNEREKGGIAKPAVFIIDSERRVRFQSVDSVSSRVPAAAVAQFLVSEMQAPISSTNPRRFPHAEDWLRALRNAVRYGVKSPRGRNR